MKITKYIAKSAAFLFFSIPIGLWAQEGQVVDQIVAKVDDKIILKSELESAYIQFISNPEALRFEGDARCYILQNMVMSKVMIVQAELDSVQVDPARVDYDVQMRIQQITQRFGSEDAIVKAYGKTIDQIMGELRPDIENQLLIQQQEENILGDVQVSPSEVRKLYNNIPKDSLPLYSTEYEVGLITKYPEVNDDVKNELKAKLSKIKERVLAGESFEILATLNSQGPSSANGGNLGFNQRGTMDPSFEAAALSLKPGEISEPFESSFGIHIVQLLAKRGNEYDSRHIILVPRPTEQDLQDAVERLNNLRGDILEGKVEFGQAALLYSDDENTKSNGGFLAGQFGSMKIPADNLPPELFFEIDEMKEGDISEAQIIEEGPDNKFARILFYKRRIGPHRANLSDDYEKLKAATTQMKKQLKKQEYLQEKMKEVYIEVIPEYNRCNIVNN